VLPTHRTTLIGLVCALSLFGQTPSAPRRSAPGNHQRQARGNDTRSAPPKEIRETDAASSSPLSSSIDQLSAQIKAWRDQEASQYDRNRSSSNGQPDPDWWSRANAIASGLAAVLIAIWAGFQWAAMNKQQHAMQAQARHMSDTLRAIQEAAEAAVLSARSAEKSLNAVIDRERARLELTPLFSDRKQPAESVSVAVRIRNTGKTDALGVKSKASCEVSARNTAAKDPSDWHHSNRMEPGQEDSLAVFPVPPFTEDEVGAIKSGETTIRLRVKTEFTDVFGIKRHVHATYRLQAIASEGLGAPRFDWVASAAKSYETEERENAPGKASAVPRVTTESESLLKL
jgi:hypothetical protein